MEIIERWKGVPNFSVWFPEAIDKVKTSILKVASKELSSYRKCTIEELNEEWVRFIFMKRGGETEAIEFGTDELHDMSAKYLADALRRMKRFPNNYERRLLQLVFEEFIENNKWPKSRVIAVGVSDEGLGNYYEMSKRIGYDYIITGNPSDKNALSKLRVRGVLLCSGSNEYLRLFVRVLQAFIARFREEPDEARITTTDLIENDIIRQYQRFLVHEMIIMEPGIREAATFNNEGYATYEISPNVLDYDNVQNVREYLRIIDKRGTDIEGDEDFARDMNINELEDSIQKYQGAKLMAYDLFISYSSKDQDVADEIYEKLTEAKIKPFLAPKDIDSGYIGSEEIRKALKDSAEMAILMSPNSIMSEWVLTEWGAAWGFDMHVTPILLNCRISDIPKLLQERQKRDYPKEIDRYIQEVLKRKNAP